MKKVFLFAIVMLLCLSLIACGGNPSTNDPDTGEAGGDEQIPSSSHKVITVTSPDGNTVYKTYFEDDVYKYTELAVTYSSADAAQAAFDASYADNELAAIDGATIYITLTNLGIENNTPEQALDYWQNLIDTDPQYAGYTAELHEAVN